MAYKCLPEEITKEQYRKLFLVAHDLYWLSCQKPGHKWYELTDFIRDGLVEKGFKVRMLKDDVFFNGISMKKGVMELGEDIYIRWVTDNKLTFFEKIEKDIKRWINIMAYKALPNGITKEQYRKL